MVGAQEGVNPVLNRTSLLRFEENKHQWKDPILYRSHFMGGQVFLEQNGFTYMFYQPGLLEQLHPGHSLKENEQMEVKYHTIKFNFLNASSHSLVKGNNSYKEYANYYIGNDPAKWATNVLSYNDVIYHELWPNINMKVWRRRYRPGRTPA